MTLCIVECLYICVFVCVYVCVRVCVLHLGVVVNRYEAPMVPMSECYERRAIIKRGVKEHEQIIYISSNRRMKQLMEWLSNPY